MTLLFEMNGNIIDTLYCITDFCFSSYSLLSTLLSVSDKQLQFFFLEVCVSGGEGGLKDYLESI